MKLLNLAVLFFLTFISVNSFADDNEDLNRLLNDYVKAVNELDLNLAKNIWSQKESISFIQPRRVGMKSRRRFIWAQWVILKLVTSYSKMLISVS